MSLAFRYSLRAIEVRCGSRACALAVDSGFAGASLVLTSGEDWVCLWYETLDAAAKAAADYFVVFATHLESKATLPALPR